MESLLAKQAELMAKVPHGLRPDIVRKMVDGLEIIESLLLFLNACGHKPWRPNPLPEAIQLKYIHNISEGLNVLSAHYLTGVGAQLALPGGLSERKMVSCYGMIEEAVEAFQASIGKPRAEALEETADILFFWLESVLLNGFSWEEVEQEYSRKWAINIERYERAEQGDYSWDKRLGGEL